MITPYEKIFQELNLEKVRYVVVGGLAVILHGYLRATSDIDLVIQLKSDNLTNAIHALQKLGYRPKPPVPFEQFADEKIRNSWIEEKGMMVFSIFSDQFPDIEIDLFVHEPFDFDSTYKKSTIVSINQTQVPVVPIDDLIEMKSKAGRPVDLQDIGVLQSFKDNKNE